ncbi:MAG: hypothetical protein KAR23_00865, partial [Candidatus Aenigmarchaeota archaeon]|nr:hypothetical protein [Candidatus Aenigmarchaeota archaeon]
LTQNVSSDGTCFTIAANNITLDGAGYTINYSKVSTGYAINNSDGYNFTTIKNATIVQGGTSSNSLAIYFVGSGNGTIANNTFTTSASGAMGIYLSSSSTNNISNNTFTISGSNAHGIICNSSSNSNILTNNTIATSNTNAYGIYIFSSTLNNIIGGSVVTTQSAAYYLQDAGKTNNFTNTNFTVLRNIGFNDATSWFNYNNETDGNIWIKTSVSAISSLNRTLTTWSNTTMTWNDTNSTAGVTATYNLTGLISGTMYSIYNTSSSGTTTQYFTTDSAGTLPSFTILLNGNTEIKVIDDNPPLITIHSPENNANLTNNWVEVNMTIEELYLDVFKFNWNGTNYTYYNDSLVLAMNFDNRSGIGENYNNSNGTVIVDISNHGNNGTLYVGADSSGNYTTGKVGDAYTFDGMDDYIDCGNDPSLNLTDTVTLEAWINLQSNKSGIVIDKEQSYRIWLQFYGDANWGNFIFEIWNGTGWEQEVETTYWGMNTDYHIAGTFNGTDIIVYKDGTALGTPKSYSGSIATSAFNLEIGRTSFDSNYNFNGTIDEVRVYNYSLSADEIQMHYNSEFQKYNSTDWLFFYNRTGLA